MSKTTTSTNESKIELSTQAQKYLKDLDHINTHDLLNYGKSATMEQAARSSETLNSVATKESGKIGEQLMELTRLDRERKRQNKKHNVLVSFFLRAKDKAMDIRIQNQKIGVRIQAVEDELKQHAKNLAETNKDMEKLIVSQAEYAKDLQDYIDAGNYRVTTLEADIIPALQQKVNVEDDPKMLMDLQDELSKSKSFDELLKKRIYDLMQSQAIARQNVINDRVTIDNAMTLIENVNSTIANVIPQWYHDARQSTALLDIQTTLEYNQMVQKQSNEMHREAIRQIKEQTKRITEQNEKSAWDPELIKEGFDNILETRELADELHKRGEQERNEQMKRLREMTDEFAQSYKEQSDRLNGTSKDYEQDLDDLMKKYSKDLK